MQSAIQVENKYAPPMRSEKKIGNTTFIVNSFYREKVMESVTDKLERMIKADVHKEITTYSVQTG